MKEDDLSQSSQVVAAIDTFTASDYLVRCCTSCFDLSTASLCRKQSSSIDDKKKKKIKEILHHYYSFKFCKILRKNLRIVAND